MPDDVVWHFIGHLQSNKAKALVAGVPNLAVLETLDTVKLANKLQVPTELGQGMKPLDCIGVECLLHARGAKCTYGAQSDVMDVACTHTVYRSEPRNEDVPVAYFVCISTLLQLAKSSLLCTQGSESPTLHGAHFDCFASCDRPQTPRPLALELRPCPPPSRRTSRFPLLAFHLPEPPLLPNQTACESAGRERSLGVFLQIDTSGEDAKSGVSHNDLDACLSLSRHLKDSCPALELKGLMTIGAPGDMDCFDRLAACREALAAGLGIEPQALELSMGMSGDFEEAIRRGSTNVRVGSTIFGARNYPNKA